MASLLNLTVQPDDLDLDIDPEKLTSAVNAYRDVIPISVSGMDEEESAQGCMLIIAADFCKQFGCWTSFSRDDLAMHQRVMEEKLRKQSKAGKALQFSSRYLRFNDMQIREALELLTMAGFVSKVSDDYNFTKRCIDLLVKPKKLI